MKIVGYSQPKPVSAPKAQAPKPGQVQKQKEDRKKK